MLAFPLSCHFSACCGSILLASCWINIFPSLRPNPFWEGLVYPPPCFQQIQAPATVSNQPTFIHVPSTSPDMVMLFVLVEVRLGHRSQQSHIEKKSTRVGRTRTTKSYLWFSWFIGFMVSLHLFFTLQDFLPKIFDPQGFFRLRKTAPGNLSSNSSQRPNPSRNPRGRDALEKKDGKMWFFNKMELGSSDLE